MDKRPFRISSLSQPLGVSRKTICKHPNLQRGITVAAVAVVVSSLVLAGPTVNFGVAPVVVTLGIDFGDAPNDLSSIDASLVNIYPTTTATNGARHTIDGLTYLGASVSAETDGVPSVNADSDTQDDGVTFPLVGTTRVLYSGQNNSLEVVASTAGLLNAWIDWNQDGDWLDAGEQIATDLALTVGGNSITVNPNVNDPHGATYARFRFSTLSGLTPTGLEANGEVEDYKVNVVLPAATGCNNLMLNTGFESNPVSGYNIFPETSVPGWGTVPVFTNSGSGFGNRNSIEIWQSGFQGTPSFEGTYFAELNANVDGRLYQDMVLAEGTVVRWQLAHRGRDGLDTAATLMGSPDALVTQATFATPNTTWRVYSGEYTVPAGQPITRFAMQSLISASGFISVGNFVDDVRLAFVCPPAVTGYKSVKLTTDVNGNGLADPADTLTWTLQYVNTGSGPAGTFQINDVLPSGLTLSSTGAQVVTTTGTGTIAVKNSSYTGAGTTTANLLDSGASLDVGGVISISIPTTVNSGFVGSIQNQATATTSDLTTPVLTDNLDNTTTGLPTGVAVPAGSISQTQGPATDATVVSVVPLPVTVSGKVWDDANGGVTIDGSETGTDAGGLTVYVVDGSGNVVDKATVNADGTYSLTNIPANTALTLRLSTDSSVAVGGTAPTFSSLPTGWTNTGENLNGTSETSTPGDITLTTGITAVSSMDFGIEQQPNTDNQTAAAQANPAGTATVQVPAISFTDPEDNANTSSTASSFVITNLPTNATLYYNGTAVTEGQTVSAYDPALLTVDPADGNQTVVFNVAAIDAAGKTDPTPATVSLAFTNTPPVAADVSNASIPSVDGPTTISSLSATDSDGTVVSYTVLTLPAANEGILYMADGTTPVIAGQVLTPLEASTLKFDPSGTFTGTSSFTYTATDNDGAIDLSNTTYTIPVSNNPPVVTDVLNPSIPSIAGVTAISGLVATDTDGTISSYTVSNLPPISQGVLYMPDGVTPVADGQILTLLEAAGLKFNPSGTFTGNVVFNFTATDNDGAPDATPATFTIPIGNNPPVATDVSNASMPSTDGPTTILSLAATDTDGTIATYTISSLPDPLQGTLFMADGVTPVTVGQVITPAEATTLKFDPSGTFTGDSSFTYSTTDDLGAVDATPATFTIPVGNNPPTATDVLNPSIPSTAGATTLSGLVASDTDGTIATYTVSSLPPASQGVLYMPDGLTPVVDGQVLTPAEAAALKFDPSGTYTGDVTFTFTATDNLGAIDSTPASFTVPVGNNPPTADDINNPAVSIAAGPTPISSLSGSDTDGTVATYTISTLPDSAQGTLYMADGVTPVTAGQVLTPAEASSLKFDPSGTFTGTVSLTYTTTDNLGAQDATPATFNIPVSNLPPEASDVLNAAIPSTAGATGISSLSASDVDGTILSYTISTLPDPTHGILYMSDGTTPVTVGQILTPAEASSLKFDPLGSFTGNASLTYTTTDNNGAVDATPATFTIPVGNNPPVADDLNASSIPSDSGATSIPSLNATDTDGTVVSYTISSLPDPTHGILYVADGVTPVTVGQVLTPLEAATLKFDPSGTYTGPASFTYTASDNSGANDPSPATVNIPIGNTPPTAIDTATSSIPSTSGPSAITSLAATDPDGTVASYTISTLPDPTQGTLYLADGLTPITVGQILTPLEASTLKFDPSGTSTSDVTFTFTATDNDGGLDATPATYTIPLGNNPPTAIDSSNPSIASSAGPTAIAALQSTDTDGTVASYTVSSLPNPTHGILYLSDGVTPVTVGQVLTSAEASSLKFDPSGTFNGDTTFTFTVTDNDGAIDPSAATYTIPVSNTPPVAIDVTSASMPSSNGPTAIDPLTATDPDGTISSYTISSLPDPSQGVLYLSDGTTPVTLGQVLTPAEAAGLKFDPSGTTSGDVTFTYTTTDNDGLLDPSPATVTILVNNTPPVATDVLNPSVSSTDGPTTISSLAATDTDGTISSYTVSSLPDPTHGILYLSDGVTPVTAGQILTPAEAATLKFDPSGSFTGTSSFTFTASDNDGAPDATPATFSIPVGNNPPTAFDVTNTAISVGAGPTTLSTGLNASDTDGTIVSYTISSLPDPTQGMLYLADGVTPVTGGQMLTPLEAATLKFDPSGNAAGTSSFTYTTTDNDGAVDSTPATYSIPLTNLAPQATDVTSPSMPSDAAATSIPSLAATDPDGTVVSYTISSLPDPTQGILLMLDGVTPVTVGQILTPAEAVSLKFDPSGTFTGSSVFSFTTTDNLGLTDPIPATVTIPVGNNPPTALDISNPSLSVSAGPTTISGLNASDTDGTIASYTISSLPDPLQGTLYLADGLTPVTVGQVLTPAEASSLKFDPSGSFVGDASFTYTATDDNGLTDVTPASVTLPVGNTPPTAIETTNASIPSSVGPTTLGTGLNATDADGTVVSYTVLTLPPATQGTLYLADGTTPVTAGQILTVLEAAGLKFDPSGPYTGDTTFTFTAGDNNGAVDSSAATYTIPVGNTPPVATDLTNPSIPSTSGPTTISSLSANDPDGTVASYTISTLPDPSQGTLLMGDGTTPITVGQVLTPAEASSLKFDPSGTFTGTSSFTYTATDNLGANDPSPATVNIPIGNTPPSAIDTTTSSIPGANGPASIPSLSAIDTDGTISSYTISSLPDPTQGTLFMADGITPVTLNQVLTPLEASTLKFDPTGTFTGTSSFTYTATDNLGAVDATPAVFTIPVANNPPIASDVTNPGISSTAGPTAISSLSGSDSDGTVVSYTISSLPPASEGVLYLTDAVTPVAVGQVLTPAEAASLKFDPSGTFNGDVTFEYTITDNNGAFDPSPATYTIPVSNTPPVASDVLNPSIPSTSGPTTVSSLSATDTDGTVVSYTVSSLPDPSQGTLYMSDGVTPVTLNQVLTPAEAATLKFDPSSTFTATSSFVYTTTDNQGAVDATPATFSIPVGNNPPTANDVTNAPISVGAGPTTLSTGLNASDTDGTISSYTISSLPDPLQGKLFMADGITPVTIGQVLTPLEAATLKFDPSGNFVGTSSLTYTTTDNLGLVDSTPATYSTPLMNLAPQATGVTSPSIPSAAGATTIPSLAATDTDGTIALYTISSLPDPTHGTLLMADGITPVLSGQVLTPLEAAGLKFDPSGTFTGTAVFSFTTTDNLGLIDASPANYTIPVGNNPPTALDINNPILSIAAGPTTISGLNASDTDGTISSYTIISLPDPLHGTLYLADAVTPVTLNQILMPVQASSLIFDPSGTFVGDVSFTYTATDDSTLTDVTAANFIIPIQNTPPSAIDTTNASIPSSADPTTLGTGLNATDADGTIASYTVVTLPSAIQGTLYMADGVTPVLPGQVLSVLEAAGLKFDPSVSYTGDTSFTFTATDNNGAVDSSAATYTIPVGNTPPSANDLSNPSIPSISGPTTISSLSAKDSDGTVVSYTISSLPDPLQGKLFMADGVTPVTVGQALTPAEASSLKFDPSGTFTGTSSFTYTATDNVGVDATPATVTIPVGNNLPTSNLVTAPSIPGTNGPTTIPSLSATDTDGTISSYTISSLPDPIQGKLFMADGVTPVMVGQVLTPAEAATLKFDPSGTFTGTSSFTFAATDNNSVVDTTPATYSIPVGNTPPVATDVAAPSVPSSAGTTSIPSLAATDSDGTIWSYTVSSLPAVTEGKLFMADGITPVTIGQVLTPLEASTLKFDPSGTSNGDVTFSFTATDNDTAIDATPATYTIPVSNTPPIATEVTSATLPSTAGPTTISSLAATDPDGTISSYTISTLPDPSHGILLMPDGVTPVTVGQILTPAEAAGLKLDPNAGFSGVSSFTFTATDNQGAIDSTPATVTIPVGNNPPSANDIDNPSLSSTSGSTTISSLSATDTDGTVVSYTISSLPDPAHGTLLMADGITPVTVGQILTPVQASSLKFDPSGPFTGNASFTYTATDNSGSVDASPATFTIPVRPGIKVSGTVWNDADGNGTQISGEPGTKAGGAFAILTDSSGTVLQVVAVANDGTYSFGGVTPNSDLKILLSSGQPSIGSNFVTPTTPSGWTNTTPSSLSFNSGINDLSGKNFGLDQTPVAVASSVPAQSNPPGTSTVNVPSTAFSGSDTDGKVTTYTITTFPTNVDSITITTAGITTTYTPSSFPSAGVNIPANPDGTLPTDAIRIDPKDGAVTVQILFTVSDNAGKTSPASSIAVPFNTVSIFGKVWEDADANQTQTASEPGTNTVGTNTGGINAVLTDSSGKVLAVVPVNTDGTYSFPTAPSNTDLNVLVSSENPAIGSTYSTPITPTNWTNTTPSSLAFNSGNAPVTDKNFGLEQLPDTDAKTSSGLSNPGGTNTVPVPALSGSDSEDGVLGTGKTFVIVTLPTNGTLIYNGAPVLANTSITDFDPTKLVFDPNDDVLTSSFTVAAVDAAGKQDATPATVTLNFKPVTKPDSSGTPAETPVKIAVLTNDSSTLTNITGTLPPANGSVSINPDGTITYIPKPGFSGTETFTYTACDASIPAQCSTNTVTVQVTPTATPDTANTPKNNPVTIPVLENDKGKIDPASVTVTTPPAHGTVIVNPDGTIKYTPAPDYEGPDSFSYQVCDLNTPGQCTTALVELNVSPNNPPVAQDKLEPQINSDVTLPLAPLTATDTDGTISSLTITALPASNQGVLYLGDPANGGTPITANQVLTPAQASSLFFKPSTNFGGEASFSFTATDNFGAKDNTPATVRIPVNAVPQSTNDTTSTPLNTPVIIPILENDKDPDGTLDPNTIDLDPSTPVIDKILILPNKGSFTATPDGKVSFVPDPSFSGSVTVPYSVNDNDGARSNTSSITVNVQAGQIYGHVFSDLNGNGKQDTGELDLVGVTVKITPEGKAPFTTKTDANGNYGANVPPGNVSTDVSSPSNTRLTTGNDPQTLVVNAGSSTTATPVGYQPLEGNLTGRVFNDANGNGVQDDTEAGLENVNVKITDAQGKFFEVTTDANGDYRVGNAAAGNATIEVTDPSGQVLTTNNNPQTVNVNAGSSSTATPVGYVTPSIGIQKRALSTEVSVGSSLEYEIVATNTSPVALRDITVIDELPIGLIYKAGTAKLGTVALEPVISVKGGRQVLTWIINGELVPDAQATLRFTTTVTPNAGTKLENVAFANGVSGSTGSPVATGKVKSAVAATVVKIATFTDKTAVVGRVYFDKDQDRNFDASKDEPLPGARVYLSDGRYAITDTQGRYNFAELEPGEHVLRLDPLTVPYKAESTPGDTGLRGTRMIVARGGLQTADFPLIAPIGDVLKVRSTTVKRGPVTLEKGLVEAGAGYSVSIKLQISAPVQDLRLIDPLPTNATRGPVEFGTVQLVRNGEVTVLTLDADGNILIPGTLEAGTYELRYAIFTDLPADLVITDPSIRYTEVIR